MSDQLGDRTEPGQSDTDREAQVKILDQIFAHSLDGLVLLDKDYNFLRVNESDALSCNRKASEFPGHNHFEFYPSVLKEEFDEAKAAKRIYKRYARPFEFPDHPEWGTTYWDLGLVPFLDADGEIEFFLFTLKDVTEQKDAENRLREAKDFFDTALDAQLDTFFLFEPSTGKAVRWNQAFREISGYSDEEIERLPAPASYYSPRDLERASALLEEVTEQGAGTIELDLICKDGSTVPFEYRASVLLSDQGEPEYVVSIGRDMTERRMAEEERAKLEREYFQAQKVESIGRLAGGIAHDLNNLLTPVNCYSELLLGHERIGTKERGMLEGILNAGERARDLVRQLLAFSKKQPLERQALCLSQMVRNTEKLLRRTIRADISFEILAPEGLPRILADRSQIEQVLLNLAVNAVEAMPQGGELKIETAAGKPGEPGAVTAASPAACPFVTLTVRDTGHGIEEHVRSQMFEPFFSTKGPQGTGLGLSTVHGIVHQHGGAIEVESEVGRGTAFHVSLPTSPAEAIPDGPAPGTPAEMTGHETVLLAEDNDSVRVLTSSILCSLGYQVLEAKDGVEALATLEAHDGQVHLLLSDVVMPGMNGNQLLHQALARQPDLRVLFMSGYLDGSVAEESDLASHALIPKPFSVKDLARKVREVLTGPAARAAIAGLRQGR